jgi:spore germination cell wall hydrolase CwlJ-like protein
MAAAGRSFFGVAMINFSLEDLLTMTRTIFGEARGEPFEGKIAVGHVILNRVEEGGKDHSIGAACLRREQFSCWNEGDPNRYWILNTGIDNPHMLSCLHAAIEAIEEKAKGEDLTHGATHYHTRQVHPYWAEGVTPLFEIGNHIFYRIAF